MQLLETQHLLIDCQKVPHEVCLDDARMLATLAQAAESTGATVISQVRYRFGAGSPPGFTAVVLLDESHCSAHSYADFAQIALDIFTCGNVDAYVVWQHVCRELDLGRTTVREVHRFVLAEMES